MRNSTKVYNGGCHCGAVKFEFDGPTHLVAWDCNCSICSMKRNTHVIVPAASFRLLTGAENLTEYKFNTNTAVHQFCKTCGICPFYRPRSNPTGYAVTLYCMAPCSLETVEIKQIDGKNWETAVPGSGIQSLT